MAEQSDDQKISSKIEILGNPVILPLQTHQNPAFLEVLAHKNRGESLHIFSHERLLEAWTFGKALKTKKAYLKLGEDLFSTVSKPIQEITEEDLQSFLELKSWLSPDSRKQRVAILKSLFKYARKKRIILVDPAEEIPSVRTNDKLNERYLSEEEVFRMIERTRDFRNRTVLKVLYGSGFRISEVLHLNWEHVQEREEGLGQLTTVGKGEKQRSVLISPGIFKDLYSLKPKDAKGIDPVFLSREGSRLSTRMLQFIVDQARILAGITRSVSPHWFRHAHASHALDRGCPLHLLRESLGHADISTTGKYLKARPNESSGKYLGI